MCSSRRHGLDFGYTSLLDEVIADELNDSSTGFAKTIILVPNATQQAVAVGRDVAKAMGVPSSAVQTTDEIGTIADVVVIVGADFTSK